ncbi:MAG: cyclic lactone autoinducer peptide [Lachnospiraceae bacterium]|nr:cyclic lactone autoinducer peptide [Lachnospiraceae bacterium]
MMKALYNIVARKAIVLCSIAAVTSTFATELCRGVWYQPEEPEGLAEFAEKVK